MNFLEGQEEHCIIESITKNSGFLVECLFMISLENEDESEGDNRCECHREFGRPTLFSLGLCIVMSNFLHEIVANEFLFWKCSIRNQ